MASLLQTIKDLDIRVYKYIQMHARILTSTDTQTHKHKNRTKYNSTKYSAHIMLINFQLVLPNSSSPL